MYVGGPLFKISGSLSNQCTPQDKDGRIVIFDRKPDVIALRSRVVHSGWMKGILQTYEFLDLVDVPTWGGTNPSVGGNHERSVEGYHEPSVVFRHMASWGATGYRSPGRSVGSSPEPTRCDIYGNDVLGAEKRLGSVSNSSLHIDNNKVTSVCSQFQQDIHSWHLLRIRRSFSSWQISNQLQRHTSRLHKIQPLRLHRHAPPITSSDSVLLPCRRRRPRHPI